MNRPGSVMRRNRTAGHFDPLQRLPLDKEEQDARAQLTSNAVMR